MYESKVKYFYGTGRRKSSVARVRVYPGSGNITINGRSIDEYFGLETLKLTLSAQLPAAVLQVRLVLSDMAFQELFSFTILSFVRFSRRLDSSLVTQE